MLFLLVLSCRPTPVLAQQSDSTTFRANPQLWLEYYFYYPQTEKLTWYVDVSYRRRFLPGDAFNRYTLRPSGRYTFRDWIWAGGGMALFYSDFEAVDNVLEFRLWQGLHLKWPRIPWPRGKPMVIKHFLRMEEQWFWGRDGSGADFSARLRYQLGSSLPLVFREPRVSRYAYLPFSWEAFFNFDQGQSPFLQDRTRIMVGLGYVFSYSWTGEFNFVWQRSRSENEVLRTSDYLMRFKLIYNFLPARAPDPDQE